MFIKSYFGLAKKKLNHPKMFTEREAKALERPRVGVGETYPLTIDENTTNVDSGAEYLVSVSSHSLK